MGLKKKNVALKEDKKLIQKKMNVVVSTYDDFKHKIETLQNIIETLEQDNKVDKKYIQKLEEENQNLKSEQTQLEISKNNQQRESQKELQTQKSINKSITKENTRLSDRNAQLLDKTSSTTTTTITNNYNYNLYAQGGRQLDFNRTQLDSLWTRLEGSLPELNAVDNASSAISDISNWSKNSMLSLQGYVNKNSPGWKQTGF